MHTPTSRPYTLQVLGPDGLDIQKRLSAEEAMQAVRIIIESGGTLRWAGAKKAEADETSNSAEAIAEQPLQQEAEPTAADESSEPPPSRHRKTKAFETAAERDERIRFRREEVSRLKAGGMTTPQIAEELGLDYSIVFLDVRWIGERKERNVNEEGPDRKTHEDASRATSDQTAADEVVEQPEATAEQTH